MSLFRPVKDKLTSDPAYAFRTHPQSRYPVAEPGTARFEPGWGGIAVRASWRRGLPRRYSESRITRTDTQRAEFRPLPGMGHLNVDLIREMLGGFRPFTPVVTVDGAPAATGIGEGVIAVPAGRHLVQLQSGASGPYLSVDVRPGEVVELDGVTTKLRHLTCMEGRPIDSYRDIVLGPRGKTRVKDGALFRSLAVGGLAAIAVLGLLALAGLTGVLDFELDSAATIIPVVATYALVAIAFGIWENRPGNPVGEPHGPDLHSGVNHRVLDPHDEQPPQAAPGRAVLRVHAVYRQDHNRDDVGPGEPTGRSLKELLDKNAAERAKNWDSTGEPAPPAARPWMAPPLVKVNGRDLPAAWGLNEYQLPPGPSVVEVAVPPPTNPADGRTQLLMDQSAIRVNAQLDPSRPTEIGAYARVRITPGTDGATLREYRGLMRQA